MHLLENKLFKMHGTYSKALNDVWRNSQYYDNHTKHCAAKRQVSYE